MTPTVSVRIPAIRTQIPIVTSEPFPLTQRQLTLSTTEQIQLRKEKSMPEVRSIAAARAPFVHKLSNQFIRRFAASILLTGVNAGVMLTFSPSVFSDSFNAPILRTAFAILILGLIASLALMWFLTFRDRS
jgi:hypothetical protein